MTTHESNAQQTSADLREQPANARKFTRHGRTTFTPPTERYLAAWNARVRASLGKPALPVMDDLPADVRAFVGGL